MVNFILRNTNNLILGLAFIALLSFTTITSAQEKIADGGTVGVPPSFLLREKVQQWVQTQKLRSKEAADWSEQKQKMGGLNKVRRKEIEQIDALIAAAGNRLTEATAQRDELLAEQISLHAMRKGMVKRIADIETALRLLIPIFPLPLQEKIKKEISRIQNVESDRSLQNRFRDAVAILGAASEFGRSLTLHSEIRDDGEQKVEVDVLYLGFSGAWYTGRGGKVAGRGWADSEGWNWVEDRSVADPLQDAIEMYRKERAPGYVKMRFERPSGGQ